MLRWAANDRNESIVSKNSSKGEFRPVRGVYSAGREAKPPILLVVSSRDFIEIRPAEPLTESLNTMSRNRTFRVVRNAAS